MASKRDLEQRLADLRGDGSDDPGPNVPELTLEEKAALDERFDVDVLTEVGDDYYRNL